MRTWRAAYKSFRESEGIFPACHKAAIRSNDQGKVRVTGRIAPKTRERPVESHKGGAPFPSTASPVREIERRSLAALHFPSAWLPVGHAPDSEPLSIIVRTTVRSNPR